ncbi:hypothetical protein ANOM_003003 [Aspergillus nomiae NRRL 13137]|uniref:Uncharacterized protein n=1 Tax=Aspergillus nomiae NRRL (strain ATCC 15546 / NRRL 13137 / CBS 260.88 / M93) TaxID=1509407 RepID=A0A0L1JBM8_ASPN3|nr:uncharacterized protein ANOM_003003 [Aspergillus nomiae NRRL 13137]KNG89122.1 hypothetical protein ANOM_003003 [Aspergillus nomiae NRRL 13137]
MAPSKVSSKVSLSQAERQEPRMVWNNTNINTVRDSQPSASTPSPAAQADSISARQLWQVIMRTQQVKLDLNLAEISAAWPTYPRPTIFALEQQLAGFRRHARAGNSVVLRRGDINVAMSAQAAADALAAATNEQIHVSPVHGGATGQTTSNATAPAHPPPSTIPGDQAMAGPSSTSFHAVNGGTNHVRRTSPRQAARSGPASQGSGA